MRALTLCGEQGLAYYLSWATIMHGWTLTALGQEEAGITRMRDGMAAMQATGPALAPGSRAEGCSDHRVLAGSTS